MAANVDKSTDSPTGRGATEPSAIGALALDSLPVLDEEALAKLREVDESFLTDIVEGYLKDAPDLIAAIRTALEHKDPQALHRAAHDAKSNSATVGASRVARLCEQIERIAKSSTFEGAAACLEGASTEIERVRSEWARRAL